MGLFLLYQLWVWEVERVEVKPDEFLVRINLWGKDLPEGEIVAPDASYKGIQRKVLPEGRHFLNPIFYTYEKHPVVVPGASAPCLTRKAGTEIPAEGKARGEFLAAGDFDELAENPGARHPREGCCRPGSTTSTPTSTRRAGQPRSRSRPTRSASAC